MRLNVAESPTLQPDALAQLFARHLPGTALIVIEDLHYSDADPRVGEFLARLIDLAPPTLNWLIVSRSTCTLPIASWITYGVCGRPISGFSMCFTLDEILEYGESLHLHIDRRNAETLFSMTDGWPAAVGTAIRSALQSSDPDDVRRSTQDLMFRYLSEQVYQHLAPRDQHLLLFCALTPTINEQALLAGGFHDGAARLLALATQIAFIERDASGTFVMYAFFRRYLKMQITLLPPTNRAGLLVMAGDALIKSGNTFDALSLYVDAQAFDEVLLIIREHVFSWFAQGALSKIEPIVAMLPCDLQISSPAALAARGCLEWYATNVAHSHSLLRDALRLSTDPVERLRIARVISILHLGSSVEHDAQVLRETMNIPNLPAIEVCLGHAVLAAVAARNHDFVECDREIKRALRYVAEIISPDQRGEIAYRLAVASFLRGKYADARYYAHEARELAIQHGHDTLASISSRLIGSIELDDAGDAVLAQTYTNDALSFARGVKDRSAYRDALYQQLDIATITGDLDVISETLDEMVHYATNPARLNCVAISRMTLALSRQEPIAAMVAFKGLKYRHYLQSRRPLVPALHAVCTAIAGSQHTRTVADAALVELETINRGVKNGTMADGKAIRRHWRVARLLVAIALALSGKEAQAQRIVQTVKPLAEDRIVAICIDLTRAILDTCMHNTAPVGLNTPIEALRAADHGGFAILFSAIIKEMQQLRSMPALLSDSELSILAALSAGVAAKVIASERGRSLHTVRTQMRMIYRKLGASGLNDAISRARRLQILK